MLPLSWLESTGTGSTSSTDFPSSGGMTPAQLIGVQPQLLSSSRFPSSGGMTPLSWLEPSRRSTDRFPSSGGMLPLSWLESSVLR